MKLRPSQVTALLVVALFLGTPIVFFVSHDPLKSVPILFATIFGMHLVNVVASFRYRCPQCGHRAYVRAGILISTRSEKCVHCGLPDDPSGPYGATGSRT
jgi:hypothetical protein